MKICIGLGILSIPSGFDILGLIPGIICLLAIGAITTWSSYMVGVFKINHTALTIRERSCSAALDVTYLEEHSASVS